MSVGRAGKRSGLVVLLLGLCGCAGSSANSNGDRCSVDVRTSEVRAQMRRDRFLIHDLENEVALLRAKLRDTPPAPPGPESISPPVAVADSGGQPTGEMGNAQPDNFGGSVYGGDVEIVYEGEAARPSRARPRIELHESNRSAEGLAPAEGELAASPPATPAAAAAAVEVPATLTDLESHRLPVMKGKIPTVDEQLRRATPPVIAPPAAPIEATPIIAWPNAVKPAVARPAERSERVIVRAEEIKSEGVSSRPATDEIELPEVIDDDIEDEAEAEAEAETEVAPKGNPVAEYRRHIAALKRDKHQLAVSGMRSFLEKYPRHYLADNVQYYIGQSYYARNRHADALAAFKRVVKRYWRGNKLPDAMLKIGLCQLALGHPAAGRAALRRLVTRFPQTAPAQKAKARLQELELP